MSEVDRQLKGLSADVQSVLDALGRGEDAQPLIDRLNKASPWRIARIGLAALQDSVDRTNEADDRLSTTGD